MDNGSFARSSQCASRQVDRPTVAQGEGAVVSLVRIANAWVRCSIPQTLIGERRNLDCWLSVQV